MFDHIPLLTQQNHYGLCKQKQMSNINDAFPHQKHLFNTIQVQEKPQTKQRTYNTVSPHTRTTYKKPQGSILICPLQKKSLQKVLILPLMDVKHYKQILCRNQHNQKQQRIQFAAHYTQQAAPTNPKKYFAQSYCFKKKHQSINSNKKEEIVTKSVDMKKQENIFVQKSQPGVKSPQIIELQTHKLTKNLFCPLKQQKDSILSSIQARMRKGKTSRIQRILQRYQNLQQQSNRSGWQWMSKWLIGRRLTNQKEHF